MMERSSNTSIKRTPGPNLLSFVEPALAMGSSMIAEPLAGLAGLATLPFGADKAAQVIEGVTDDLTYAPRSDEGKHGMRVLSDTLAPVGEAIQAVESGMGDYVMDKTGSPALAAAAYSVPTAIGSALGLKGGKALPGKKLEFGNVGSQVTGAGRKEKGLFAGIKAKGADLNKLEAAKELTKRGYDRKEIWTKTGWFEDTDSNWKWEIDDSAYKLDPSAVTQPKSKSYQRASGNKVVDHPELKENYGELIKDMKFRFNKKINGEGQYKAEVNEAMMKSMTKDQVDPKIKADKWTQKLEDRIGPENIEKSIKEEMDLYAMTREEAIHEVNEGSLTGMLYRPKKDLLEVVMLGIWLH